MYASAPANPYPVVRRFPPVGSTNWCSNPFLWDTDGDSLADFLDTDSDGDGMPDWWEESEEPAGAAG